MAALGLTWCTEGGDDKPFQGHHYTSLNARLDDTTHRHLILDVRPTRGVEGGEMALGVHMIKDFYALLGDDGSFRAVYWDGAMRGVHAVQIMKSTGAMPMHQVRTDDKPRPLKLVRDCACGGAHQLYTAEQTICVQKVDGEGTTSYQPVPRQKIERRGRRGSFTVYLSFASPVATAAGYHSPTMRAST